MTERCARHDLARGPSGECIVCKRERLSSVAPPVMRDGRKLLAFGAGAAVITLAAGGLAVRREMPPDPAPRPVPVAEAQTTARTSEAQTTARTSAARPTEARPNEARATEARDVPITVYTTSWCPVCKHAKQWLAANEIPFTERDVEADPQAARDRRALTSERGVPTIDVDGEVLVGFDRTRLTQMIEHARQRRL